MTYNPTPAGLARDAAELQRVLTAALARLDVNARATPTQLLMAGQYCEPTLFDGVA